MAMSFLFGLPGCFTDMIELYNEMRDVTGIFKSGVD